VLLVYLIFNSKKGRESFAEGMLWALILLPILANAFMGSSVLRTFHRIKASMTPLYIVFPVIMMLVCSWYYLTSPKMTVDAVLFIQLCVTAIIVLIIRRNVRKKLKEKLSGAEPHYKTFNWLKKGTFHATGSVIDILMRRSDILIIGYLSNHLMSGYYGVAVLVTSLVAFGLSVTDYVFLPKLKAAHETGKRKVLQAAVHQASRQVLAMSAPLIVLLMISGSWLLSCFGPGFTAAFVPMLILLVAQAVEAAMGLSGNLLTMYGRHAVHHWICGLSLMAQVFMTLILVPYLGMTGAALSAALSRIGMNIFAYRAVNKTIGIRASVI
jgi:O-antigen/teichoic acid export membrane protein